MVSELRTEANTLPAISTRQYRCQGCDGFTRYCDRLSMNHFSSVVDKACIARYR